MNSTPHPHDLSPWGMFLSADPIVQGILMGLAAASVITWTVWLAKSVELLTAKRRLRHALGALGGVRTLGDAAASSHSKHSVVDVLLSAAQSEIDLSGPALEPDGIKERIILRFQRIEAEYGRRITRATGVLATIGATAPFVGLFGTVWGIMNSFVNIAEQHTTNLAVVAPGIAEALLATAVGLGAAIPAVVIYNVFARSIAGFKALLADASAEVLRLASRDLDLRRATASAAPRLPHTLSAAE